MGWFWSEPDTQSEPFGASCPISFKDDSPSCPVAHGQLDPKNLMPYNISQKPSPKQNKALKTEREVSSIPRADQENRNWEYPSHQQMYNALLRKGYDDTDEQAIPSMVGIHNYLNEGAWREIEKWERKYTPDGYRPMLAQFEGNAEKRSPKSRIYNALGSIMPSRFSDIPPFDRHDWYIKRYNEEIVRYVIDYYAGPDGPDGEPTFYLDVRPALDRPMAFKDRLEDTWKGWWKNGSVKDM